MKKKTFLIIFHKLQRKSFLWLGVASSTDEKFVGDTVTVSEVTYDQR